MTDTQQIRNPEDLLFHSMSAMRSIEEITDGRHYRDVPANWHIAITDVVNSTDAIAGGRYKAVNAVAVASITAVLNSIPAIDVPFLFGGDGAIVVVPPSVRLKAAEALAAVRRLAREHFQLDLRIGMVPVKDVLERGYTIKMGKLFMSEHFQQPVFTGGGLGFADELIKSPSSSERYSVDERGDEEADFNGFECRWSRHPASRQEVVSLLVKAIDSPADRRNGVYDEILSEIRRTYGDPQERHPIRLEQMRVATDPRQYRFEAAFKESGNSWVAITRLMLWSLGGFLLWKYVRNLWNKYRMTVYGATDHEKFDDMLRMTISGTSDQRESLRKYLFALRDRGRIVFGMHIADHSLMTCIVFERFGKQVHFLDADRGGYAMAAKEMKAQLAVFAQTRQRDAAGPPFEPS